MSLRLVQTCGACPEQYDVFDEQDEMVGYLRLRHGYFAAHLDGPGGEVAYASAPNGDGCFDSDERDYHLDRALTNIARILEERR